MEENMHTNDQEASHHAEGEGLEHSSEETLTDETNSESPATDNVENENIEKLTAQLAAEKDSYLRLTADFENYRKRMAKERLDLLQNAGAEVMKSLLEVLDDTDRSLTMMEKSEDVAQIKDGVKLVFHKLKQALQSQGLTTIEAKGKDFDTDLHEAITNTPASEGMQGKVVDVIQNGYFLNDKLLRHAKVVVGQ